MQAAFERAVTRLFARLGVPGTYRLADGREIATWFIAKQADVVESFGDTRLALATHRFDLPARGSVSPSLAKPTRWWGSRWPIAIG